MNGGNMTAASPAPKLLETSRLGDRFDATINQTADLANRLSNIASKLMGSIPEGISTTGTKDAPTQIAPSFIRATDARFDTLNSEIDRAFAALTRLEQFA